MTEVRAFKYLCMRRLEYPLFKGKKWDSSLNSPKNTSQNSLNSSRFPYRNSDGKPVSFCHSLNMIQNVETRCSCRCKANGNKTVKYYNEIYDT